MSDPYMDIEKIQEMFLYGENLYSWHFQANGQLLYSNSPNQDFFYNIFLVGDGFDTVTAHFSQNACPIIYSDKTGIAWIAAAWKASDAEREIFLLGPFFTVDATEKYIWQLCSRMKISQTLLNSLFKQLKLLPTIPLTSALRYGIMLYYCVSGKQCFTSDIALHTEATQPDSGENWNSTTWHGTWAIEQKFFKAFREGTIRDLPAALAEFSAGHVGVLSADNPLRQAKNEVIVLITLLTRNAMIANVAPEGAYNLADYYFQRVEACVNVSDTWNYCFEACQAFILRVLQAKKESAYSKPIATCMEYIETHITEKIRLKDMAAEAGYTHYYLSSKFQKETGDTIAVYIQKRKVEYAKNLLKDSRLSIADVSQRLSFSSPSYFSSVFKKYTGMSPAAYIQPEGKKDRDALHTKS